MTPAQARVFREIRRELNRRRGRHTGKLGRNVVELREAQHRITANYFWALGALERDQDAEGIAAAIRARWAKSARHGSPAWPAGATHEQMVAVIDVCLSRPHRRLEPVAREIAAGFECLFFSGAKITDRYVKKLTQTRPL